MKPFLLGEIMLTQDRLKELLHYDYETGIFTWRISSGSRKSGSYAGCEHSNKYICIDISGKKYRAHRLAWLYVYGSFPYGEIDHINRIENDNRISNLRDVKSSDNRKNTGIRKDNKSGFKGVSYLKENDKWRACIRKNGKGIHLGCFLTPQDAYDAYKKASIELFPEINGGI